MKITILNGNPAPTSLDTTLAQLGEVLEAEGHSLIRFDLRDLSLRYCIGCWGCWVKTPGRCSNGDAVCLAMDRAVINTDFVLWASPLKMGFPSHLLKMALDKHLPLIHPYILMDHAETHHRKRYAHYPRIGLLLEQEPGTDERDLLIVRDIFCRTALNLKTRLEFCLTSGTPPAELARRILIKPARPLPLPPSLSATSGVTVSQPTRLTLFNGSPRGRRANTSIFLDQFARGFGSPAEMHHLIRLKETDQMVQAFAGSECVLLGFPLYTDAMPGIVKHFIETLEPLAGRKNNPSIGFLVQSGFPEGLHSRYVERYLERLAERLGCPYLGTIIKGNGEGVRLMPPDTTRGLFDELQALGAGLRREGHLDPQILSRLAAPERYPALLGPFYQLFMRLPLAHAYFDDMLKKNGVYAQRFARPFVGEG
jgi:multimeric flavodoxin WrbA